MQQVTSAPSALVIFGVTGNLSQHMLIPALYHLERQSLLPEDFAIVGIFRREVSIEQLLETAMQEVSAGGIEIDQAVISRLKDRFKSVFMNNTDPEHYDRLTGVLAELDEAAGAKLNHLFYLAVPPNIFKSVTSNLASAGLNTETDRASRILVEKPFGDDLESAEELINFIGQHFQEEQIYRIDHFLAKETAQNILTFRLGNPLIEAIWNRQFIDHIQITVAEQLDIQGRAAFYEGLGALRDMIQSHIMQLMALVMMEYPQDMTAESIHAQKLTLLNNIRRITPAEVGEVAVRGQYEGYRTEVDNSASQVETFAALKLEVDNDRWRDVPVLIRTGKAMSKKNTEITVLFRDRTNRQLADNMLKIRLQPNEGISLELLAKKPGFSNELQPVHMDFSYAEAFEGARPDAYQRVLIDALRGDRSLFASSDEVLASWRLLQPILDAWHSQDAAPLESYVKGADGPAAAITLAERFDTKWYD